MRIPLLKPTFTRVLQVVRFRPHDTATERGRSLERYRRMVLTGAAAFGSRGIGLIANLISIPLTFRYLGAETYGLWMVLMSLITMMGFADLGIGNGLMNSVAEAYGKGDRALARQYVTSAFVLLSVIALVLGLAGACAYPHIPWQHVFNVRSAGVAGEGASAFLVLFAWFAVNLPLGVISRAQAGLQQAYWANSIAALGNIVSLFAVLVVIELRGGLPWLVFASTFGSIASVFLNGLLLFREHPWLLPNVHSYRGDLAQRVLKLGLMFFVLQAAVAVSYTSDNVVITQVLGAAAVASYAVPQKLFSTITSLVTMGIGPIWPAYGEAVARGDTTWVVNAFRRSLFLIISATVPIYISLVLLGPWFLRAVMGKSLHVATAVFVVLGMWGILSAALTPVAVFLNGAGIIKEQMVLAIVTSVINLGLSILLTRRFGVIGVCCGSFITQLFIAVPVYFMIIRRFFRTFSSPHVISDPASC